MMMAEFLTLADALKSWNGRYMRTKPSNHPARMLEVQVITKHDVAGVTIDEEEEDFITAGTTAMKIMIILISFAVRRDAEREMEVGPGSVLIKTSVMECIASRTAPSLVNLIREGY